MKGHFVEVVKWRDVKVNADKSKAMVFEGEEGLICKIRWGESEMEQIWGLKYLGFALHLDDSGENWIEIGGKLCTNSLLLEYGRILHNGLLVPVLMYGSKTVS